MCGRFDTSHLSWADIHAQLTAFAPVLSPPVNFEPNPDVRPTDRQYVARLSEAGWTIDAMRWGLIPWKHKGKRVKPSARGAGDGFKLTTFNCRTENFEVGAKPSWAFDTAFRKQRCIVPATAWFEWTGPEGKKVKHRFARADEGTIWFAGIWDRCETADEGDVSSFSIMTGPSSGWLSDIHTRAPVILEPAEFTAWLDPARDANTLMSAVRAERFLERDLGGIEQAPDTAFQA